MTDAARAIQECTQKERDKDLLVGPLRLHQLRQLGTMQRIQASSLRMQCHNSRLQLPLWPWQQQ